MSSAKSPVLMDATEMMKGLKPEDLKALLKAKVGESMHTDASPAVLKRINALKHVQVDLLKIEANFYDELHELELKYAKSYEPLFEKRRKIVVGEVEPTEEEGKWTLDDDEEKPEEAILPVENGAVEEKGIKNFWLETLQSFRITSEIVQEYDEEILGYLEDIQVKLFDKKPYGYSLEFTFSENPFFSNKVLTKTYILKTEVDPKDPFSYDGPDLEKATGCLITWKEGKNVCKKMVKKKLKSKNKKQPPKIVTKEEKQDSFFNFFETPKMPKSGGQMSAGEEKRVAKKSESEADEEDEDHDAELYLIADFEIGQYLKEKIIPKAILFYTGEGVDDEFDEDDYDDEEGEEVDDEEDEDEDDDDDDEEDDDEEEDEDEDSKPKAKKNKAKVGAKAKSGEPTPSECKQN